MTNRYLVTTYLVMSERIIGTQAVGFATCKDMKRSRKHQAASEFDFNLKRNSIVHVSLNFHQR
jgi:hypothetical protein